MDVSSPRLSIRISSRVVPRATTEIACVWPRVKSAEPCVRGSGLIWMSIARISSGWRPSGRFFWIAMRSRMIFFSSASNASCARWRNSA